AFEHDLGGGGESKAGFFSPYDRNRLSQDGADVLVLAHSKGDLDPRDQIGERIGAAHDRDRKTLAGGLVLLVMDAAVLARHHVERDVVAVDDLYAVRSDVDPIGIEVARHHRAA